MEKFRELGLSANTVKAIEKKGFTEPTSIQSKVIPLLLKGEKDVVGQSQTGTGKTASFGLPMIERLGKHNKNYIRAIVLAPTRELASQVAEEINSLKGDSTLKTISVYGGASIETQIRNIKNGVDIIVGTPGRVMDLQRRGTLKLNRIEFAVLDEADEMLNMGFVEDIKTILENAPEDKNMLLFSATMPKQILAIAENYMREYEFIEVEKSQTTTKNVEQLYYDVQSKDRSEAVRRIIDFYPDFHGIIFCNRKSTVDTLTNQLSKLDHLAASLHGDISQGQREKILQQFKDKKVKALIATDVAARGIDVNNLTHVINFSLPQSPESYVHRIGRTGRAGKKGIAITLVIPSEKGKVKFVERINNCKLTKAELPDVETIIENKEKQIKVIINNIIEKNKTKNPSKYNIMAKEFLKEHSAEEIIAGLLKYGFKNDLNIDNYKNSTQSRELNDSGDRGGSGSGRSGGRGRGRSDRGGRGRSDRGGSRGGRSDRGGSRDGRSRGSSDRSGRGRGEGRARRGTSEGRSESKFSDKRSGDARARSRGKDRQRRSKNDNKKSESRGNDKKLRCEGKSKKPRTAGGRSDRRSRKD